MAITGNNKRLLEAQQELSSLIGILSALREIPETVAGELRDSLSRMNQILSDFEYERPEPTEAEVERAARAVAYTVSYESKRTTNVPVDEWDAIARAYSEQQWKFFICEAKAALMAAREV